MVIDKVCGKLRYSDKSKYLVHVSHPSDMEIAAIRMKKNSKAPTLKFPWQLLGITF
jgi:hypothetical protein